MAKRPISKADPTRRLLTVGILQALRERYHEGAWAFIPELATTTGQAPATFLDAWAMTLTPSSGFVRVALEIKVTTSDLAKELRHPDKRRNAFRYSNYFYFVTSKGLFNAAGGFELPEDAGLMEYEDGTLVVVTEAPYRDGSSASWPFVASLLRRALKLQSTKATLFAKEEP